MSVSSPQKKVEDLTPPPFGGIAWVREKLVAENTHAGDQRTCSGVGADAAIAAHHAIFDNTETTCTCLTNTGSDRGIALHTINCGWTSAGCFDNSKLIAALAAGVQHRVD